MRSPGPQVRAHDPVIANGKLVLRCTPEARTLDFGGTLADRKWQADRANRQNHDRAERALQLALAARVTA
jgi:hypothetical protein